MNPCEEFFASHSQVELATLLQAEPNALAWEVLKASAYSPGPVADVEKVIRLVYHPVHVDVQTGELKPSVVDEASSWGCSVQREGICSIEEAWKMGDAFAAAKTAELPGNPRSVHAVAVLRVEQIRLLNIQSRRGAAVYDTALPNNIAHADICVVVGGRQERRSIRSQLFELALAGYQRDRPVHMP